MTATNRATLTTQISTDFADNVVGTITPALLRLVTQNIVDSYYSQQDFGGPVSTNVTLANGLNSNIALPATGRVRIIGPSGGFSVGGFVAPAFDGYQLYLFNTVAQTMTIVNNDASSTAANRILTLSGSNVVLRTSATSFATMSYDLTLASWILMATN